MGYKEFRGKYTAAMLQINTDGYRPLTIAGLMQLRLEAEGKPYEPQIWDSCLPSSDALWRYENKLLIQLDSPLLKDKSNGFMQRKTFCKHVILTPEELKSIEKSDVQIFSYNKAKRAGIRLLLSPDEVLNHPIWNALVQDRHLLSEYTDRLLGLRKDTDYAGHLDRIMMVDTYLRNLERPSGDPLALEGLSRRSHLIPFSIKNYCSLYGWRDTKESLGKRKGKIRVVRSIPVVTVSDESLHAARNSEVKSIVSQYFKPVSIGKKRYIFIPREGAEKQLLEILDISE